MHELPVTQNILDIATKYADEAGATRILRLNITIGALASIIDDSIKFYWDIIAEGTKAEGAVLYFHRIPIKMQCIECKHTYQPEDHISTCPECNSNRVKVIAGQEFFLDSIEVE